MPTASSELRFIPKEKLTAWERWEMAALAEARAEEEAEQQQEAVAVVDATARGYAEGLAQGRKVGHAEGHAAGLVQVQAEARQLAALGASAQQVLEALQGGVSERVVDLALAIARQVVREELAIRPESVVAVVREALAQSASPNAGLQLVLHPADAAIVRERMAEEITRGNWSVLGDESMERGGCRIHSAGGDIDASIAVRWKHVLAALGRKPEATTDTNAGART